ncbi:MAG: hypothetical protein M3209_15065 [Acidobacteriota bacterium]|nr:hypothetical protein [Acidobacteriota bacterium]
MFESHIETKNNGLLKITGNLFGAVLLFGVAAYFPATFLIALYQYQNAQTWEVKKCEVYCQSNQRQYRPRNTFTDKFKVWMTVFYDVKPEIERPAETDSNSSGRLKLTEQELKERKEMEESMKRLYEFPKLLKRHESLKKRNYSIYHLGGWQYWGEFGLDDFCRTNSGQTRNNGSVFESDCYVNPADKNEIALYRNFNLGWYLPMALLLSLGALILLIYLVKQDYLKSVKGT